MGGGGVGAAVAGTVPDVPLSLSDLDLQRNEKNSTLFFAFASEKIRIVLRCIFKN